ncbi:YvcK family protein [Patescibacteria group bacterium]|nr:YvcK family protein [Patescibacteria group bacterium]
MHKINISTIGGGTGSFTLLSGIKRYKNFNISAIVTTFDNGGSTGRLIDEFGILPIGDIRQSITALSEDDGRLIRQLFTYRFDKGSDGLKGHSLGNLILTVLTEILGSENEAIKQIGNILHIKGRVLPISYQKSTLIALNENNELIYGENNISEKNVKKIKKIYLDPKVLISIEAKDAILNSDFIIIGPGDLYTSILPNIIVSGTVDAIKKSNAKIIYVMNLISKKSETYIYKASDYIVDLEKYLGKNMIDFIIINTEKFPENILEIYKKEDGYPIIDDLLKDNRVIRAPLLSSKIFTTEKGDAIKRSLIRHDSIKLARLISKVVNKYYLFEN